MEKQNNPIPPATVPEATAAETKPIRPAHVQRRNDPLHGITLKSIVNQMVQKYGWREMGRRIPVRCFKVDPSVNSSLAFLRKTPWAREKVEDWFIGEVLRKNTLPPKPKPSAPVSPDAPEKTP